MELTSITTSDGTAEALFVLPVADPSAGPWPGVLLGMDALGVRPRLEEMAREIASWGYAVLVPNALYRTLSVAEVMPAEPLLSDEARSAFFARVGPSLQGLTAEQVEGDLDAWIGFLRASDRVAAGPLGFSGRLLEPVMARPRRPLSSSASTDSCSMRFSLRTMMSGAFRSSSRLRRLLRLITRR